MDAQAPVLYGIRARQLAKRAMRPFGIPSPAAHNAFRKDSRQCLWRSPFAHGLSQCRRHVIRHGIYNGSDNGGREFLQSYGLKLALNGLLDMCSHTPLHYMQGLTICSIKVD